MKKIKILFLLLLSLAIFTNCSETFDNSWSISSTERILKIDKQQYSFTSESQSESAQITAKNVPWTISNNAQWLSLSPSSGSSSTSVSVSVLENKSDTARLAYPVLSSTDVEWTQTYPITVTQNAPNAYINISDQSLVFDGASSFKTIIVESNYKVNYSKTEKWLTLEENLSGVKITVEENTEDGDRSADVIVTAGSLTKKILVTQRVANVSSTISTMQFGNEASTKKLSFVSEASWTAMASDQWIQITPSSGNAGASTVSVSVTGNMDNIERNGFIYIYGGINRKLEIGVEQSAMVLSAAPTNLAINANGEGQQLNITANTSWTLSTSDSWINLTKEHGNSDEIIMVTATKNTGDVRTGTVTLKNGQGNVVSVIRVVQEAGRAGVIAMPRSFNLGIDATTSQLFIMAEGAWSLRTDASWITLSETEGVGESTIDVFVTKNATGIVRDGNIIVYDESETEVQRVKVHQTTFDISASVSEITLLPEGSTAKFNVYASSQWQLTAPEWVKLSQSLGDTSVEVEVSATENNTNTEREGYIQLFNEAGVLVQTISVTQPAAYIKCSPASLNFSANGSTATLNITSNTSWRLSKSASWLSLSGYNGKGDGEIIVTVTGNFENQIRTDDIFLQNSNGMTFATVKVVQTKSSLTASSSDAHFASDGGQATITVNADEAWKLSVPDWTTVSEHTGNGNATLILSVSTNPTHEVRHGSVVLTNVMDVVFANIDIEQEGNTAVDVYNKDLEYVFSSGGSSLEMSSIENVDWTAEVTKGTSWISLSSKSGSAGTELVITTSDNPSGNKRQGEIQINYGFHTYICPVVQAGKSINVSTGSVDFFAKGGQSSSIIVTADKTPEVKSSESWLTVSQNGKTFTLTATKNTTAVMRQATVSVSLPGISDLAPATITVRQAGVNGTFTINGFGNDEDWN